MDPLTVRTDSAHCPYLSQIVSIIDFRDIHGYPKSHASNEPRN